MLVENRGMKGAFSQIIKPVVVLDSTRRSLSVLGLIRAPNWFDNLFSIAILGFASLLERTWIMRRSGTRFWLVSVSKKGLDKENKVKSVFGISDLK